MISKKFIYILTVLVISCLSVQAIEKASVNYEENRIDYSRLNYQKTLKEADNYFTKYETSHNEQDLTTALGKYYIATKINPNDLYSNIQLARIYGQKHSDRLAKSYFNKGLDINKKDPYLNYYFGEFYFSRNDYRRALRYYKTSYNNGYSDFYDLNVKLGTLYEKLADLVKAESYYQKANSLNKQSSYLSDKILQIQSLNYDQSEYYPKNRKLRWR